jgi:hypothetical protein
MKGKMKSSLHVNPYLALLLAVEMFSAMVKKHAVFSWCFHALFQAFLIA